MGLFSGAGRRIGRNFAGIGRTLGGVFQNPMTGLLGPTTSYFASSMMGGKAPQMQQQTGMDRPDLGLQKYSASGPSGGMMDAYSRALSEAAGPGQSASPMGAAINKRRRILSKGM